jgi:hypothetical protein
VQAVSGFSNAFIAAYADLSFQRFILTERKKEISTIEGLMAKHRSDIDRWLETMRQMNIQGGSDADRFKALVAQFDFSSEQLAKQSQARRA